MCSIGLTCLPLIKVHLLDYPFVYSIFMASAIGVSIVAVVFDVRAYIRRNDPATTKLHATPPIIYLADIFIIVPLTIFIVSIWH